MIFKTFAVAVLAVSLAGCALQTHEPAVEEIEAEPAAVQTEAVRRKPTPAPVPAPNPAPMTPTTPSPTVTPTPTPAAPASVCAPGVSLSPTTIPDGYKLSVITGTGGVSVATLVPDPSAKAAPLPAGYRVECFTTSYGERMLRLIPPLAPTIGVNPGGQCGFTSDAGESYICVPGSTCLAPADNQPGICQPFPTAPVNDG